MITLKRRKFLVEKIVDFCKEMGANDVLTAVIPDQEPKLEFDIKSPLDEDENGQITLTGNKHQDMLGQGDNDIHQANNIFEVLGFFRVNTSDQVYLCPANILYYVAHKFNHPDFWKVELQIVTEIVFVHECAHWLHYKLNAQDFVRGTKNYIESWAQLCTKRMCVELGAKYCQVFEEMLKGQSKEYTCFTKYQAFELGAILEFFLKPATQDPLLKDLGDLGLENELDTAALTQFNETKESSMTEGEIAREDLHDLGCSDKSLEPFIDENKYQGCLSSECN